MGLGPRLQFPLMRKDALYDGCGPGEEGGGGQQDGGGLVQALLNALKQRINLSLYASVSVKFANIFSSK